jgi:hypothetical protein
MLEFYKLVRLVAKQFFNQLYEQTEYHICKLQLQKIEQLNQTLAINTSQHAGFINSNKIYLKEIADYSNLAFELLNLGKTTQEVDQELAMLKKFST